MTVADLLFRPHVYIRFSGIGIQLYTLGLATIDLERAWTELETLISGQCYDGMILSIVFRSDNRDYFPGPEIWQIHSLFR